MTVPAAAPRLPAGIRRVAVFRALVLGDLLCATPALRALRAGLPGARIALVGLPWARELVARLDSVDDFIEFPGWPGLPERPLDDAAAPARFIAGLQAERFDLAVQLHGSGSIVNPLVASFGARCTAGFADAAAWLPPADAERYAAWPATGTEVDRLLALTDHLSLPRRGLHLDFPLRAADRQAAARLLAAGGRTDAADATNADAADAAEAVASAGSGARLAAEPDAGADRAAGSAGAGSGRYAIVHPGSQLPSRRWPAERYAAVADALHDAGLRVLLTGSAAEAALTVQVAAAMRAPALDLAGRTTLWTLGALVERAALVVGNDTGISHVAAALATPSVVVSSGGDARRWAPADSGRHRVLWHDMACRPCAHAVCPIGHGCALAIDVEAVREAALQAVEAAASARPRRSPQARPEPAHAD